MSKFSIHKKNLCASEKILISPKKYLFRHVINHIGRGTVGLSSSDISFFLHFLPFAYWLAISPLFLLLLKWIRYKSEGRSLQITSVRLYLFVLTRLLFESNLIIFEEKNNFESKLFHFQKMACGPKQELEDTFPGTPCSIVVLMCRYLWAAPLCILIRATAFSLDNISCYCCCCK